MDIATGEINSLWWESFYDYSFDPTDGTMVVSGGSSFSANMENGLFFSLPDRWLLIEKGYWAITYRGSTKYRFLANGGTNDTTIGIDANGNVTQLPYQLGVIEVSPDLKWMIAYNKTGGIALYDENDSFVRQISNNTPEEFTWSPDSKSIFILVGSHLYYVSIPDGEPILVDQKIYYDRPPGTPFFAWVKLEK